MRGVARRSPLRRGRLGLIASCAALALGLVVAPPPAGAIETAEFGIDPVDRSANGRLEVDLVAGQTSSTDIEVWNKSSRPLTLELVAVPASLGRDGTPVMGGDVEAAGWVTTSDRVVDLRPGERRIVTVDVRAPRRIDGADHTAAVLARPRYDRDEAPAVIQQVGVVVHMRTPVGAPLVAPAPGGVPPWVAGVGAALLGGAALLAAFHLRRLRDGRVAPPRGASIAPSIP